MRWFVEAMCKRVRLPAAKALRRATPKAIEDFFVNYSKRIGPEGRRTMQAAMRSFLVFAASRGWVSRETTTAVPSLRRYRLATLPRALPDEDIQKLVEVVRNKCSARDQAIVFMLAHYGVRCGQVSALRLDDIDWRARTILFRPHKGGKAILHQLVPAVADPLVRYLRDDRPNVDGAFAILRKRKPYIRLGPSAVKQVVSASMERSGLECRRAHALRHSFAVRLLRLGQPLKAIADLLGHRSLASVATYAKVDRSRLLEVAVDWPKARS
ncbi:MAG: tyrosine-type recombinase/integrase [Rhodoglobus sp.]